MATFNPDDFYKNPGPGYFWDAASGWKEDTGSSNSGGDSFDVQKYIKMFEQNLSELNASTDKYIAEMLAEAGGDRAYLVKKLDAQHELAVGNNDTQTATFLEKVADKLESTIGRIPYDYEKYSARELEDYATKSKRLGEETSLALTRLAEDEKVAKQEQALKAKEAKVGQQETLAQRGIIQGTRDGAEGIASNEVNKLNQTLNNEDLAIERAARRSEYDTNLKQTQGSEDLLRSRDRNIADLQTTARRGVIDANQAQALGTEGADLAYKKQQAELERKRYYDKLSNRTTADSMVAQNMQ